MISIQHYLFNLVFHNCNYIEISIIYTEWPCKNRLPQNLQNLKSYLVLYLVLYLL